MGEGALIDDGTPIVCIDYFRLMIYKKKLINVIFLVSMVIFGGISFRGLIPVDAPLFLEDVMSEFLKKDPENKLGPKGGFTSQAWVTILNLKP